MPEAERPLLPLRENLSGTLSDNLSCDPSAGLPCNRFAGLSGIFSSVYRKDMLHPEDQCHSLSTEVIWPAPRSGPAGASAKGCRSETKGKGNDIA